MNKLSEYYKKRGSFTPEPKVQGEPEALSPPIFVVQKHDATSLHYDFRIEYKGTLVSWAVPKGFPQNTKERHLAKKVEDHPFSYRNFEGVIPEGSYGAGAVIVWDQGYYVSGNKTDRRSIEEEIDRGLSKGHFSFTLAGKKLNGRFALAKLKSGDSDWLLIRGKQSGNEEVGLNSDDDTSVLSGLSLDEVFCGKREPMPHNIKPMMAFTAEKAFDQEGWIFEIKWDGYRAISEIGNNGVKFYSRNLHSFKTKFPLILSELEKIKTKMVLDGEIVVVDSKGKPDFQALQDYLKTQTGNLVYYIFDLLYLNGRNLMNLPLFRRKELLKKSLPAGRYLKYCDHINEKGRAFFEVVVREGIEGIMAKDENSRYKPGIRTREWLKIKREKTTEAIIAGYTLPESGRKYFSALILGAHDDAGSLRFIGNVGTGFNDRRLRELSEKFKNLSLGNSPFKITPKINAPLVWLKPVLVCTVKFTEWTKEKIMRQPVFVGLRNDVEPGEVRIDGQ